MRRLRPIPGISPLLLLSSLFIGIGAASGAAPDSDLADKPLSPAQVALFETPHLKTIDHPEALHYSFERTGIAPLTDTVTVKIEMVHPDGTKLVSFNFLTGANHQFYPSVDDFSGNPLLMLFLEHDVQEMKQQVGVAAAYLRDHIRAAFVDQATVSDTTIEADGKKLPAKLITLRPFAKDTRFEHLPTVQGKTYSFVLADELPGEIQLLKTETPGDDATHLPAWSEAITFTGAAP